MKNTYEDQIEAWHGLRVSTLKNDSGWLALAAAEWLREGTTLVQGLGRIMLQRGKVSVQLDSSLSATVSSRPFVSGSIKTDADQGGPDRIKVDSRTFIVIKRGDRFVVRMWDTNSDARRQFAGIHRYAISTKWNIEAQWEPYKKSRTGVFHTTLRGYSEEYLLPGTAVFNLDGKRVQLEPVVEEGSRQLIFIFSDETNGPETNEAGRYLYAFPGNNATVVLDFNKAINPPCAFTPYAICPLPLDSNRLKLRVDAGEKKYEMVR